MTTEKLKLPELKTNQTQKELVFNSAMTALDALVQASAISIESDPPLGALQGDVYLVGPSSSNLTGAFIGHADEIAQWRGTDWIFYKPKIGWYIYLNSQQARYFYDDVGWGLDTGAIGLDWMGEWNGSETYEIRDGVSLAGSSYIAIAQSNNMPPPNAAYWDVLALNGVDGSDGTDGINGADGVDGADGSNVIWRGAWSAAITYAVLDGVERFGSSYVANAAHTNQPPPDLAFWDLFVSKGDQGFNFNWRGAWSDATEYQADDAISYLGSSYVCIASESLDEQPDQNLGTSWELLAAKGDTGEDGADGGPTVLGDLTDVDLVPPPKNGQALVFNIDTNKWQPGSVAGGGTGGAGVPKSSSRSRPDGWNPFSMGLNSALKLEGLTAYRTPSAPQDFSESTVRNVTGKYGGKWYAEIAGQARWFGITRASHSGTSSLGAGSDSISIFNDGSGQSRKVVSFGNVVPTLMGAGLMSGIRIAVDFGAKKIWFGDMGTPNFWIGNNAQGGDPATGSAPTVDWSSIPGDTGAFYLAVSMAGFPSLGNEHTIRINPTLINFTPPVGFSPDWPAGIFSVTAPTDNGLSTLNSGGNFLLNQSDFFIIDATGGKTVTFDRVAMPVSFFFVVEVENGADGVIWPDYINWTYGAPPILSANKDTLVFYTLNGGGSFVGALSIPDHQ